MWEHEFGWLFAWLYVQFVVKTSNFGPNLGPHGAILKFEVDEIGPVPSKNFGQNMIGIVCLIDWNKIFTKKLA